MTSDCYIIVLILHAVFYCQSEYHSQSYPPAKREMEGRLIGSVEARPYEFPYQLLLRTGPGKRFCGASLIELHGIQFALTAAHCMKNKTTERLTQVSADSVRIMAGSHLREDPSPEREIRRAALIVMHPMYKKPTGNDIALVFYEPPFPYKHSIRPVNLPQRSWSLPQFVTMSGWGIAEVFARNASKTLRKLTMETISNEECQEYSNREITDSLFCVLADEDNPQGTCSGDSGGPVVSRSPFTNTLYLYGIVSFHQGNCGDHVSAFTLVSYYMKWISNTVTQYKRWRLEHG